MQEVRLENRCKKPKLTAEIARSIVGLHDDFGFRRDRLAFLFEISPTAARDILSGKSHGRHTGRIYIPRKGGRKARDRVAA
jgi:hypothetical protein